jgi:hypothetical protein
MSLDHPIGDPTGGAAYGEKNDPISAAISIGTMFATAEAGFAAMTVMQGITFAGAAVSLIGNVSGNKDLMKLGMVAGIAGGLGSLAESQGLFSSGNLSDSLGMGAKSATNPLAATPSGSALGQTPVSQVPPADATSMANAPSTLTPSSAAPSPLGPSNAPIQGLNTPIDTNYSLTPPGAPGAPGLRPPGVNPLGQNLGAAPTPGIIDQIKAGNYGQAISQAGTNAMDALKNNPTGAYVAAQTIGGVANWLSGKTDAELDALKANTGYANAKAQEVQAALDREKARRANLNASYGSVNAGFTVNPNAVVQQPWAQQPGLIAGARPA